MPKTAVGLFKNPSAVDEVVREIESLGFPRYDVRTIGEPLDLGMSGVLSIPRVDFEVDLFRQLTKMGVPRNATEAYVDGVRRGGVLVFATGSPDKVDEAAAVMNRCGAVETEEEPAAQPHLHTNLESSGGVASAETVQVGRRRQSGGGAGLFFW